MISKVLAGISLFFICSIQAQNDYKININASEKQILRGHLDLGGNNPKGDEISVNSYYIEKGGKPFFPVIGEFHYSRFPHEYWEEEILKMKAGGINVIATYVFWNIHERTEGVFDWSNDLNLRKFAELCKKNDIFLIVRMGPFCHGEMRNGGIPDWLYGRVFEIRSNDDQYLEYVDKLYKQIAEQIKGLLYKDGGPVIGVQLENEYQHSAAPWEFGFPDSKKELTVADWDAALAHEQISDTEGENPRFEYGKQHMSNLKQIAIKHGIEVPIYTATGWGNASIVEKGSIPVTAGYAYPFWADPSPSDFYLFKDIHKNPDYSPVSYDVDLYPSIPSEIGPGIQPKYARRPIVAYESVNPLMVRTIGSGSNGIGYYMYHGGTTPQFEGKYYNEQSNGIPRMNYDFQAPIGQYGQTRYHYKHLRMLHMFLESYGETLAPMKTVLPDTNEDITSNDTETLRYAVRSYKDSGFLFMINFQDHLEIRDIKNVSVSVETDKEIIKFPSSGTFDVLKATSAIFPFNLKLNEVLLKSATVQPLTILHQGDSDYFIFSSIKGIDAELNFPLDVKISALKNASVYRQKHFKTVKLKSEGICSFVVNGVPFLILPQELAINTSKIGEHLYISEALILDNQGSLEVISQNEANRIHVFPSRDMELDNKTTSLKNEKPLFNGFKSYSLIFTGVKPEINFKKVSSRKYVLSLTSDISSLNDVFVNINYIGDRGAAFIEGIMITDHLYQERKWEMSLKPFASQLKNKNIVLVFSPMYEGSSYLEDLTNIPDFEKGKFLEVNEIEVKPEYKATLK